MDEDGKEFFDLKLLRWWKQWIKVFKRFDENALDNVKLMGFFHVFDH